MGGDWDESEVSTTQNFALKNNHRFLWGLLFVLNSTLDVKRVDSETLNIVVKIPYGRMI